MRKVVDYFFIDLLLCGLWMALNGQAKLSYLHEVQAKQRKSMEQLEMEQKILKTEIMLRTHPEYVDMMLRDYFDRKLKDAPEQVIGIDGKLPKERF